MTVKRSVGLSIILSFVTCGIYMLYWYYKLLESLYVLNGEESRAGTDLLLSIVTCGIYTYYMMYKSGTMSDNIRQRYGVYPKNENILFLVLTLFGLSIVVFAILQSEINEELSEFNTPGNGSQWN